jgi:hypothetical protein
MTADGIQYMSQVASWNDLLVERRGICSDTGMIRVAAAVRRIGRLRVKINTRDG